MLKAQVKNKSFKVYKVMVSLLISVSQSRKVTLKDNSSLIQPSRVWLYDPTPHVSLPLWGDREMGNDTKKDVNAVV